MFLTPENKTWYFDPKIKNHKPEDQNVISHLFVMFNIPKYNKKKR